MALTWLVQMAPSQTGGAYHEIAGICFAALFAVHHCLNRGWLKRARRGRMARVNAAIDLLMFACVIGIAVTGILMGSHALPALAVSSLVHVVRPLHSCLTYAGLMLIALHTGLHAPVIAAYVRGRGKKEELPVWVTPCATVASLVLGAFAFVRLDVATKLTMGLSFSDGSLPLHVLVAWHLALAAPFVTLGALAGSLLWGKGRRQADAPRA